MWLVFQCKSSNLLKWMPKWKARGIACSSAVYTSSVCSLHSLYHRQLGFQFLEDGLSVIGEASSVLTNWRGVAGFYPLGGSVLTELFRSPVNSWVSESLWPLVGRWHNADLACQYKINPSIIHSTPVFKLESVTTFLHRRTRSDAFYMNKYGEVTIGLGLVDLDF